MTVLAGGVVATYASTGVVGVPLSFLLLCAALALFTIGYVAMSRHVPHAATFYAFLARGLGRVWGVGGAALALLAYNCIQISLYGLFGVTLAGLAGGAWWMWALLGWLGVAVLGILHVNVNVRVLAVVLVVEIALLTLMDLTAFADPAGGSVSFAPLMPGNLLVDGLGGVLALGVAAFVGYESAPIYSEEARDHRAVSRASF
ncbi:MAG TPA: amino acid permease, partial [Micromonospora sp.]